MRDEEVDAARLVAEHLGGVSQPRDPGGGATPMHDFDLMLGDGRVIAVEVTRHTVSEEIESRAAVTRKDWQFPALRRDWVVNMVGNYNVREVHQQVPPLVSVAEMAGVESCDLKHDDLSGPATDALLGLRALGVRSLYCLTEASDGGGLLTLGSAPVIGATAADAVVQVVEHHANLADNVYKLGSAGANERHLFIWVETGHHHAVVAMAGDALPHREPRLPEHVDVVWLATRYDVSQVWRFVGGGGWEDLGIRHLTER